MGLDMELTWEPGFTIDVDIRDGAVVLSANREGLLSLANHLRGMAEMPPGCHVHLDEHNSLEDGSAELIIERIP